MTTLPLLRLVFLILDSMIQSEKIKPGYVPKMLTPNLYVLDMDG